MSDAHYVMGQTADPLDQASAWEMTQQAQVIQRSLPQTYRFILATYHGNFPLAEMTQPTTRSKILDELGIEGKATDPKYALVRVEEELICYNDARALRAAQAYLKTFFETSAEFAVRR